MNGFFDTKKIQTFQTEHKTQLQECDSCGLHRNCRSPRMPVSGKGEMGILLVGEFPSVDDDMLGSQFVDGAGKEFSSILRQSGIDINRDCWKTNAVQCCPMKDYKISDPTEMQIQACHRYLLDTVAKLKPKFIWVMGSIAIKSFFGKDFNTDVNLWRGLCIPDQEYGAWLLPMFEPASLIKQAKDINFLSQYNRDVRNAVSATAKKAPSFVDPMNKVKIVTDFTEIKDLLHYFNSNRMVFDYETTGLKPYKKGHRIVSISFATPTQTISFPFDKGIFTRDELSTIENSWTSLLVNPNIGKVAHNLKFENEWSAIILNMDIANWEWCTMTNAHILDNRRHFTSLNFQAYCNFGIRPYDQYIDAYKKETDNGLNRMLQADTRKLLEYGGMDSAITQMLFDKQVVEFSRKGEKLNNARRFFHEGLQSLSCIELNGFPIDEEYYAKTSTILSNTSSKIVKEIEGDVLYKKFEKLNYRPPDIQSSKDLNIIIYDYLKTDERRTEKNNLVSDKGVLETIDHPFTKNILQYRRYKKISDFVDSMVKLGYNGAVHGTFDLNHAISMRGNAHSPNLQNINVRDEVAKRFCRSGFRSSFGNRILESDFSSIEVTIGNAYHKDPMMTKYLTDPNSDMHRDCACDIWKLPPEEVTKMVRFYAKNCWTFPQFYGDWYKSCAEALWENVIKGGLKINSGITVLEHLLQNTNIRNFNDFVEHCKEVESVFWGERFKVYDQWKKDINEFYRKHGYIESFLGFKFTGNISRKDASNYVIQGTSFHMLLWTLNQVIPEIKKRGLKSKAVCQIHDSQIYDVPNDEFENLISIIENYGTIKIREQFEWINVPLKIEHEITGIDGVWTDKEAIVKRNGIWYFERKDAEGNKIYIPVRA